MRIARQTRKLAQFLGVIWRSVLDHWRMQKTGTLTDTKRAQWLHRWSKECLRALNITVEVNGTPPSSGLLVCNHLSYIDVLVLSSAGSCVFVSKSDVESWPLVGPLTKIAGTLFIDRTAASDTRRVNQALHERFAQNQVVVFFPEGTSTGGDRVLRFHSSLYQPAISNDEWITPACLYYEVENGNASRDVCYWADMVFGPHFWNLLAQTCIHAKVSFGSSARYNDRKSAARDTREVVVALGLAMGADLKPESTPSAEATQRF